MKEEERLVALGITIMIIVKMMMEMVMTMSMIMNGKGMFGIGQFDVTDHCSLFSKKNLGDSGWNSL